MATFTTDFLIHLIQFLKTTFKMKALVLVGKGEPLAFKEVEKPVYTEGSLLVTLKAASLNHRDVWIQKGLYAGLKFPTILGSDGAGDLPDGTPVILHPGRGWGDNPRFQSKNYEILGLPVDGTFAEFTLVPNEYYAPKPAHLTYEEAAALPLAGLTAYRALFTKCQVKKGDKVLISGIGGGVALFALQFALAAGCDVWVTSSSDEKIEKAVKLGAKGGFNYKTEAWAKAATAQTGGFDAVIDGAVGGGFAEIVKACASGARLCFYGGTAGPMSGVSPQIVFYKQLTIMGSTMGSPEEFLKMIKFVKKHKIVPIIDSVYELSEGNVALAHMDSGQQFGKIVLSI
jgi:zinc-binding alcohol dehydrogenase/oxidoreductase